MDMNADEYVEDIVDRASWDNETELVTQNARTIMRSLQRQLLPKVNLYYNCELYIQQFGQDHESNFTESVMYKLIARYVINSAKSFPFFTGKPVKDIQRSILCTQILIDCIRYSTGGTRAEDAIFAVFSFLRRWSQDWNGNDSEKIVHEIVGQFETIQ